MALVLREKATGLPGTAAEVVVDLLGFGLPGSFSSKSCCLASSADMMLCRKISVHSTSTWSKCLPFRPFWPQSRESPISPPRAFFDPRIRVSQSFLDTLLYEVEAPSMLKRALVMTVLSDDRLQPY